MVARVIGVVVLLALCACLDRAFAQEVVNASVRRIVDGDTIILQTGEHVRYVGIDTPERGEPFYGMAKRRNRELVSGVSITLEICASERTDKYGRLLADVLVSNVSVNETLVKEGLAKALIIPPCGLKVADRYKALEAEARKKRLGMWAVKGGNKKREAER
ncbi:MAG: thermonuclease family protein [Deltaproteobacteria bacterium]|nr:thermonuclease family protein [Deltaproteobacteria bacterium]